MKKGVNAFVIIIFAFSILQTIVSIVSAVEIDSCQTLSSSGVYALNQSVNSSDTCFHIGADDIIIDGSGFTINYSTSSRGYAVNNTDGHTNITIKNLVINQTGTSNLAHGVYSQDGRDILIENNTMITRGANAESIYLNGDTDSVIVNNNITSLLAITIQLETAENITVSNNTIYSNGSTARGITMSTSNSTISGNNITAIGTTDTSGGIFVGTSGNNNQILSNTINITAGSALLLSGSTVTDNNFSANTFLNDDLTQLVLLNAGINETVLTDQRILGYNFTESGSLVAIENTTYGKINFTQAVNGSGNNLVSNSSSSIRFGNNSLVLDSTDNSGLNKAANVTLYGIGNRGFTTPGIYKNGAACSDCYNFTSLTATNVVFNISGSGSYSIVETAEEESDNSGSNQNTYIPAYWQNTYVYDEKEFSEMKELALNLSVKQRVKLKINGEAHYIGVISLTQDNVTINVSSTPQQKVFKEGEENRFDVDEDGYVDINVAAEEIVNNKVNLLLTSLHEELEVVTDEETNNVTANTTDTNEEAAALPEEKSNKWVVWLVVILIVIAAGIVLLYLRWKKTQEI